MKAIRVHEFGGPEVLNLEEVATPKPSAGQVLVRIHAAGVNPADTYMRAGTYAVKPTLPYTPGSDSAGTVEAVGEGVKKVRRGDRVYTGRTLTGAYAEYALALEEQVHPLPANIDFKQGAGIWVPYGTAYHALHHSAKAHASETALVHGASGGVGIATLQIARSMGLKVHAFKFANLPFDKNADPFTAVIRCTCGDAADNKTISKWARALRYASRRKKPEMRLKAFMKDAGGVNACAAGYSKLRRRSSGRN